MFLSFRYGLGMIYYKQEKFNLAEIHFKKALSINPQSSVLLCHIGVVSISNAEKIMLILSKAACTLISLGNNSARLLLEFVNARLAYMYLFIIHK